MLDEVEDPTIAMAPTVVHKPTAAQTHTAVDTPTVVGVAKALESCMAAPAGMLSLLPVQMVPTTTALPVNVLMAVLLTMNVELKISVKAVQLF